jgi:3-oxoacyl-[acyl-carrier protein] reductase
MTDQELNGKTALITGAGRGIGRAIALKLAGMGAKVAVNDLAEGTEAYTVSAEIEALGGKAIPAPGNVSDSSQVKALVAAIIQKWGRIDILVNNAGISSNSLIIRLSEEEWDSVLDTNLKSAYLCSKFVLRSMISLGWGRIVNMASVAGIVGSMGRTDYSASKGGLIAFTRSLAAEVGSRNITVNAVAPGFIATRLTADLPREAKEAVLSRTVLKRHGTPAEVADLVGFLVSNRAGYITGQVISIDGGIT